MAYNPINHPSAETMGLSDRRSTRSIIDLACLYSREGGPECDGTVINLSREGCTIRKTAHVQRGESLQLSIFPTPNQSPIEICLAVVRWSNLLLCGVEFIIVAPQHAKRLQNYLALIEHSGY